MARYADSKGVVHRDLKPSNILVSSSGAVKLLDYELAKAICDGEPTRRARRSPSGACGRSCGVTSTRWC
ncbi:protein kinase [Aquabacterium sp. A7-Y]|uniref:protein kinase domain-containing protein n=1 Tax=Aquabacterium sp. A7-Y TaxID=1349605 RepID=UPI00223D300A|nr:protein kinase [Aquabacterium sp. A7-Y]MCW7541757.1 protein kinase [Aquabacterium sp. A7-Y]